MKVHIEFLEVDIENGDVINIHTSWESGAPAWKIDNQENPPKVEGYGEARFLLMEFQSRKKKSKGFRGVFKVKRDGGKIQIAWARSLFVLPSGPSCSKAG